MTTLGNLEHELTAWFAEQVTTTPPDLLPRAMSHVTRVGQRPGFLVRQRYAGRAVTGAAPSLPVAGTLILALVVGGGALLAGTGGGPGDGVTWSDEAVTAGAWAPSTKVAFRAQVGEAGLSVPFKWRAGTYSEYTGSGWRWGDVSRRHAAKGEPLEVIGPTADILTTDGHMRVVITITPESFISTTIVGPSSIVALDKAVDMISVGPGDWYASLEAGSTGPYIIDALIPASEGPGAFTETRLRSAGTDYPAGMTSIYTALPSDAVGPNALALLHEIRATMGSGPEPGNAYDLARAIEAHLRDSRAFAYDDDIRDSVTRNCTGLSTVECFATIRRGYCDYYASTMAVLLRVSGVPARVVYGFLPGARDASGTEVVGAWLAHIWVEVYFPGTGWIEFDPTGGGIGRSQPIPAGP